MAGGPPDPALPRFHLDTPSGLGYVAAMRSAAQRQAAYDARMLSSQIDPSLTAMFEQQKANYAGHVAEAYPLQVALRGVLDGLGIGGQAALIYEAYSAELYGLGRKFTGPAAVAAALPLSRKYTELGATPATICAIGTTVHGVTLPVPGTPVNLLPANHAGAEPKAGTLTWTAAAGATGYNVWLGPNAGPVIEVSHDQRDLAYNYSGLAGLTLHDWYIFGNNACGQGAASATFDFTTVA